VYGQLTLETFGTGIPLSADGCPLMKHGGVTIDWGTVTAAAAELVFADGIPVHVGEKYLRVGQVVTMIGVAEVQTATWTGGPTAGNAFLTIPASGQEVAQTTVALPFNAAATDVLAALQALPRVGPTGVAVTRTGTGIAGDPYVFTVTFTRNLGDMPQMTATHTFTGGTTPTVTIATTTAGSATGGFYGPYDSAATDGRQTLERGRCFLVGRTWKQFGERHGDYPPAVYGGLLYKGRILATTGAASLAAGPTFATLEAAMPQLSYVAESPA
jgi:hypothetical protein